MFSYFDSDDNPRAIRCGSSSGFGYRHIRDGRADGFTDLLDSQIQQAFSVDTNPEHQGTTLVYNNAGFIVVFETATQSDGAPKGIITAYSLARAKGSLPRP